MFVPSGRAAAHVTPEVSAIRSTRGFVEPRRELRLRRSLLPFAPPDAVTSGETLISSRIFCPVLAYTSKQHLHPV